MISHLRHLGIVLSAIVLVSVVGCAAEPQAQETNVSVSASTSATPTPTPTVRVVGGGERPPQVFGGECAEMLDVRTLSAVTGLGFEPTGDSGVDSGDSVVNVGGTNCSWRTETGEFLLVSVLPEWGIGQERLGREAADFYFGNCESDTWVCTVAGGDGELWIAVSGSGGVGAHDFDEFAPILMDDVATSWHAREERPWTRDTTEWAHALDCGELAERMSAASGVEITASAGDLYIDPPHAVFVLADQVSRASGCTFEGEGLWADIVSRAGTGWSVADGASDRDEINIGRVALRTPEGSSGAAGANVQATDGVNLADIRLSELPDAEREALLTTLASYLDEAW